MKSSFELFHPKNETERPFYAGTDVIKRNLAPVLPHDRQFRQSRAIYLMTIFKDYGM